MRRFFPIVLASVVAHAEVYTWTDKDGVVHFTDNPASVPGNVKAKVTDGEAISTVTTPAVKPKEAEAAPAPVAPKVADDGRANELKAEREWRAAFRDVNERIARLEDEIELDRKKVEEVNGLPVAGRYQCVNAGGWVVPGGMVVSGAGTSVTVGSTSQGVPGFAVQGSVVTNQVVVPNVGIATAPCVYTLNPEFERAKERLELNRKALGRAKAELSDLERRASLEAVPREWRR